MDRVSHPILSQKMVRPHQFHEKTDFLGKWLEIRKKGFGAKNLLLFLKKFPYSKTFRSEGVRLSGRGEAKSFSDGF